MIGNSLILMADGSQKQLAQIKIGDKVQTYVPQAGMLSATVVNIIMGNSSNLRKLDFKETSIIISDEVSFWYDKNKLDSHSDTLFIGEKVTTTLIDNELTLYAIEDLKDSETIYGLQLDGGENYVANDLLIKSI